MKKEDSLEVKVVQHDKNNKLETQCRLLKKQQENGISPWKNAERKNKKTGQQHLEAREANAPLFACPQASKPLLMSMEEGTEDFQTELTLFNDLVVINDLKSCNEYLPYYRTYTSLLETSLDTTTDVKYENAEGEDVQSNGCIFKPKYEDEPLKDMGFATGYFPYYRSFEEYFGSSDLASESYSSVDSEEAETSSTGELESDMDCEIEEVYEDTIIQENGETNGNTSQGTESFKLPKSHFLTNSIIEPCDSENSFFNEIVSLNQPSSSRGYFPYYRTYGKMILSPEISMFSSSEDAFVEFGLEVDGTGEDTRDYSNIGCSVC